MLYSSSSENFNKRRSLCVLLVTTVLLHIRKHSAARLFLATTDRTLVHDLENIIVQLSNCELIKLLFHKSGIKLLLLYFPTHSMLRSVSSSNCVRLSFLTTLESVLDVKLLASMFLLYSSVTVSECNIISSLSLCHHFSASTT